MQIEQLKIYCNNLEVQTNFYENILAFKLIDKSEKSVSFKVGKSILIMEERETTPYHFAFNIPSNQIQEAFLWLKDRVEILRYDDNEIQNFDFWNAKAIYFYDADQNIVEFIARENLNINASAPFGIDSLLEISEIGIPTTDIEREFNFLSKHIGLDMFSGSIESFCAIGNENALFICIDKNVRKWFPLDDEAYSSEFDIVLNDNLQSYHVEYMNEKLNLKNI